MNYNSKIKCLNNLSSPSSSPPITVPTSSAKPWIPFWRRLIRTGNVLWWMIGVWMEPTTDNRQPTTPQQDCFSRACFELTSVGEWGFGIQPHNRQLTTDNPQPTTNNQQRTTNNRFKHHNND